MNENLSATLKVIVSMVKRSGAGVKNHIKFYDLPGEEPESESKTGKTNDEISDEFQRKLKEI